MHVSCLTAIPLESRQSIIASGQAFSDAHWATIAELGWLGLTLPEAEGGFGGNQIDTMVIMEQFGKGLVLEPFYASIVLGARALILGGSDQLKQEILPAVIEGRCQLAFGYAEEQARFDLNDITTRAKVDGDMFILNGHKSMVQNGGSAQQLIVSARTAGAQTDTTGITLFVIDTRNRRTRLFKLPYGGWSNRRGSFSEQRSSTDDAAFWVKSTKALLFFKTSQWMAFWR